MDPFRIICVTCGARLTVGTRSAIGQILACPRCHSMVEVMEPTDATDETETSAAVETMPHKPAEEIAADSVLWESTAEAGRRKLIAWAAAGLLVGASAVTAVLIRGDAKPLAKVLEEETPRAETGSVKTEPPAELPVETIPQAPPSQELAPELPPPIETPPEIETAVVAPTDAITVPSEPAVSLPAKQSNDIPPALNPFDFDPEQLDLAQLTSRSIPPTLAAKPLEAKTKQHPKRVKPAQKLLRSQVVRIVSDDTRMKETPDAEARLAQRLPKFSAQQMPLYLFLNLLSRMTGVPISVEPEQLRQAGVSPRTEVSVEASNLRFSEVLIRGLKPLRLQVAIVDAQIILQSASARRVQAKPPQAIETRLTEKLSAQATFTFSHATPLAEVFRHWQRESGIAVLVDWPALAESHLRPQTNVICAVADSPWQTAFDLVLEPLGLKWHAVPGEAIEITSVGKLQQAIP